MRLLMACVVLSIASPAWADPDLAVTPSPLFATRPVRDPWRISWSSRSEETAPAVVPDPLAFPALPFQQGDGQPLHAAAVEHSDAYQTRAKIHKYASFATLPLFAAEVALGQSLY